MDTLYSVHEVSMKTGVKLPTIYKRIRARKLNPKMVNGVMFFDNEDVKELSRGVYKLGRPENAPKTQQEDPSQQIRQGLE